MAITLPDIIQRVVLDTKGFNAKGLGQNLNQVTTATNQLATANSKNAKQVEAVNKATATQDSKTKSLMSTVKKGAPTVLTFANNFFKARSGMDGASKSAGRTASWLDKLEKKIKSGAIAAAKFAAKMAIFGTLLLAAIPAVTGLAGGLVAMLGSLSHVVGVLPAMATGLAGVVAVGGVALLIFKGMGNAMKEHKAAQEEAAESSTTSAQTQRSNAKAIADAQQGIYDAQRRVADGMEAVGDAQKAQSEAYTAILTTQKEGQRDMAEAAAEVRQAQDANVAAVDREREARERLHEAYEQAKEDLEDLKEGLERLDISEERAEISVREAHRRLSELSARQQEAAAELAAAVQSGDPYDIAAAQRALVTADDLASAQLDIRTAELDLQDAREATIDQQAEITRLQDSNLDGAGNVISAQQDLADAVAGVGQSEVDLWNAEIERQNTQVEAAQASFEAEEKYRDSLKTSRDAVLDYQDAVRGLGEAHYDLQEARLRASEDASGGGGKKAKDTATGPEKALVAALDIAKKDLKGIKETAQTIAFPGVIKGLEMGTRGVSKLKMGIFGASAVINDAATTFGFAVEANAPKINEIWGTTNNWMGTLIDYGISLFNLFIRISDAAQPILTGFGGILEGMTATTNAAGVGEEKFGRMQAFMLKGVAALTTWWHIVRDFAAGIFNVFSAGSDEGQKLSEKLEGVAAKFRDWSNDEASQSKLRSFFETAGTMLTSFFSILGRIGMAFGIIATGPALPKFVEFLDKLKESPTFESIMGGIEKWGTSGVVGVLDRLMDFLDVLSGEKEASTDIEKMAGSISKLTEETGFLGTFAEVLQTMVDGVVWAKENIPGFEGMLGGLAAVMATKMIVGKTGLGGALSAVAGGVKMIYDYKNRNALVIGQLEQINTTLAGGTADGTKSKGEMAGQLSMFADTAEKNGEKLKKTSTRLDNIRVKGLAIGGAMTGAGFGIAALGTIIGGDAGAQMEKYGSIVAVAGTAVGGLASLPFGDMKEGLKGVTGKMKDMTKSILAQTAAWLTSPVGLVVIALAALGAALYLLYKNNEGFRKFVDDLWQSIQRAWDQILPVLKDLWAWIKDKLIVVFELWWKVAKTYFTLIFEAAKIYIGLIIEILKKVWWYIETVVIPVWSKVFDAAKIAFGFIVDLVKDWWENRIKPLLELLKIYIFEVVIPIWTKIFEAAKGAFDSVVGAVMTAWGFIKPILQTIITFVMEHVVPGFQKMAEGIGGAFSVVSEVVSTGISKAQEIFRAGLRGMGNLVGMVFRALAKVANLIPGLSGLGSTLTNVANESDKWGEQAPPTSTTHHAGGVTRAATGAKIGGWANARRTEVGAGFKTGVPRAIVGEGSRHPEYVVPTDPTYRGNALNLFNALGSDLGVPGFGIGGFLPNPVDIISDAVGGVVDKLREIGVGAIEHLWPIWPAGVDHSKSIAGVMTGLPNGMRETTLNFLAGTAQSNVGKKASDFNLFAGGGVLGRKTNDKFLSPGTFKPSKLLHAPQNKDFSLPHEVALNVAQFHKATSGGGLSSTQRSESGGDINITQTFRFDGPVTDPQAVVEAVTQGDFVDTMISAVRAGVGDF